MNLEFDSRIALRGGGSGGRPPGPAPRGPAGRRAMDLDLGPDIAEFHAQTREWIATRAPEGLAELADWNMAVTAGGGRGGELPAAGPAPAPPGRGTTQAAPRRS